MAIKDQIEQITNKLTHQIPSNAPLSAHLSNLVHLNREAAQGFREASKKMDEAQDELLFKTYADQRERFASVLQSYIDEDAQEEAPAYVKIAEDFVARAHRVWMSLQASLSDSKLRAMLKECSRGDEAILSSYDLAIKASASKSEVHDRLTNQRADIRAVHDTLARLIKEHSETNA